VSIAFHRRGVDRRSRDDDDDEGGGPRWFRRRAEGDEEGRPRGRASSGGCRRKGEEDARSAREGSRHEKDCELLSEAEGWIPPPSSTSTSSSSSSSSSSTRKGAATAPDDRRPRRDGRVERWIRHADRDPILSLRVMETDPSCARLSMELVAAITTSSSSVAGGGDSGEGGGRKAAAAAAGGAAAEIVRDLCHRTAGACAEIRNLETRLGRYQKFSWDSAPPGSGGGGRKRKSGAVAGGAVDKILAEWPDDGEVCSLVYVPRKRKFMRPKSQRGGFRGENDRGYDDDDDDDDAGPSLPAPNRPKPFVVKINAAHYRKLRAMFDSCYGAPTSSSASAERATHAYHAALFSLIMRYSALSGGQQINDFRGGGMQGAVHDAVFDTLSRWFGGAGGGGGCAPAFAGGTECFASPFNSALPSYLSAFPSPDLDGHFGSRGDFFMSSSALLDRVFPPGGPPGWFELNPPFSPGVMTKMADGVGTLLETHERMGSDVTCIVVIPTVRGSKTDDGPGHRSKAKEKVEKKKRKRFVDGDEGGDGLASIVSNAAKQSFNQLVNSPYCRSHIILPAREHGFLEGGQHLRPTKFKESQCSTSVIVLRSKSWMDPDDARIFESELREAFASRHAVEMEQRKGARLKES
jgi:phosphorylated CTD-interacting factor 1